MKHKKSLLSIGLLVILSVLLSTFLSGCGSGAPKADWDLKVTGAVTNPLTLSYAELVKMPEVDLSDVLMQKSLGEDEITSWAGVPLEEIFKQAGVSPNYVSITAIAADGYAIEVSKDEAQGGIVATKRDGEWIVNVAEEEDKGPIRLVCPDTPANRWVFQLQEIQVNE